MILTGPLAATPPSAAVILTDAPAAAPPTPTHVMIQLHDTEAALWRKQ
jgi:hypothetical protein